VKITYFVVCLTILFLICSALTGTGFAQSTQCVVNEVEGSLMTLVCPGVGTIVENIGGTSDRYKVGDTVARPTQGQGQGQVNTDTRPTPDTNARSGRR